ncbi:MAG: hypothetical protein JHD35_02935 [Sphingopyxis sp.]|nr:hypothetical protein [Sphingopyxis sp.]
MHMLMVIAGGTVLLGVFLLFGYLWGGSPASLTTAAKLFVPVWLAISVTNLWIGVSRAGYTLAEEIPILLGIFAVPVVLAALAVWQYARS